MIGCVATEKPMPNDEAREHRRARARIKVEYHFGTTTAAGQSNDISEGGLFLECDRVAPQGMRVYLRVHLPGSAAGDPLKIIGIVTRTVDADHAESAGSPPGMGLHFEVAYARTREHLAEFMETLLLHSSSPLNESDAVEPKDIRLVPGSTSENKTYLARFPELASATYKRMDTLRPPEVDRVFAFDAGESVRPAPLRSVDWRRIGILAVKLAVLTAIITLIAFSLFMYSGKFAGAR
jgi:hypothetical protein